jgi:pimeloyl-ACP methyl ester carboxylesterase
MAAVLDAPVAEDQFCDLPSRIRLCYRVHGVDGAPAVLLIAGLGLQLIWWTPALINDLVARGLRVIVFDNRDAGRSTHMPEKPPSVLRQLLAMRNPKTYALEDMASDALGLLDHLGIERFHVAGMSMGGMIAQVLAARHPQRVVTLTSIFSTTGHRKVGQPAASTMWKLAKPPARSLDVAVARYLDMMAHVGSTAYPMPEHELRAYAAQAWARGAGPAEADGESRQIGAIINSGDRTSDVSRITAPTLVLHGDVDKLVAPSGGRATAQAIAGARLVTLPGLGHHIPDGALPQMMALLEKHMTARNDDITPRKAYQ